MTALKKAAQIFVAIAGAWLLLGTAARAQESGYIRVITSGGHQMAGESIDPAYPSWIPFRSASMPTQWEMEGMSQDSSAASSSTSGSTVVHRPVVIVKYRDKSSLGLLGAMTSHQVLPEVDIVFTSKNGQPTRRYKLTDASVISVRAGGTNDDTDAPMEQVRFNYAKIEMVR
ncbi:MAG: type VI secretion system tube protein Hcp [Candidatus Acidiferrales bacterium]|jgi:type VI protein secretion system component Hcp